MMCGSFMNYAQAKDKWTINQTPYEVDTLIYKHIVGPGTTLTKYTIPGFPLFVSVMEMDLTNPYAVFETCKGGDRGVCEETPVSMYERNDSVNHDMIGATNGDFYFYTDTLENGIPRSGQFRRDECITNPVGRACLVLDDNNVPYIDRVDFQGTVKSANGTTRLHTVNMQRLEWEDTGGNQLNLYTNAYGPRTEYCSGGTKVIIETDSIPFNWTANCVARAKVVSFERGLGYTDIPAGKALLWGRGTSEDYLKSLKVGDVIHLTLKTDMRSMPGLLNNFKEMMGGSDNIILKDGQYVDDWTDRHPRTCLGYTPDKKKLFLLVIDGRQTGSAGASMHEMADIFTALGASDAVNLDGGGSSIMIVNNDIINHPSDGYPRPVGNGCLVYSKAPKDDNIGNLAFAPRTYNLMAGAMITPEVMAYNKYWVLKNKKFQDAVITCDPEIGSIKNGVFTASIHPGQGKIYATYGDIKCEQVIGVMDGKRYIRLDSVSVDDMHPYKVEVLGTNGAFTDFVDPSIFSWKSEDTNICTIDADGNITAVKEGTTNVIATGEQFQDTIQVKVMLPKYQLMPLESPANSSAWKLTVVGGKNATAVADGEGININFTGSPSRANSIKLVRNIKFPGIPESFQMKVKVGDLKITDATLVFGTPNIVNITKTYALPEADVNGISTIDVPMSDLFDTEDMINFPVNLYQVTFKMSAPTSGTAYTFAIPAINLIYKSGAGVSSPVVDKQDAVELYPNPVNSGESVTINNVEASSISIYNQSGALCKKFSVENNCAVISTKDLTPGIYLISVGGKSAKLIVK